MGDFAISSVLGGFRALYEPDGIATIVDKHIKELILKKNYV